MIGGKWPSELVLMGGGDIRFSQLGCGSQCCHQEDISGLEVSS